MEKYCYVLCICNWNHISELMMENLSFLETIDQKRKRKKSSDESSIVAMKKSPRQDGCKFSTFLNINSVKILEKLYKTYLNNLHGVMVVVA